MALLSWLPARPSFYVAAGVYLSVLLVCSLGNDWASARGREALAQQHRTPLDPTQPLNTVLYDAGVLLLPHWYDHLWLPDAGVAVLLLVAVALVAGYGADKRTAALLAPPPQFSPSAFRRVAPIAAVKVLASAAAGGRSPSPVRSRSPDSARVLSSPTLTAMANGAASSPSGSSSPSLQFFPLVAQPLGASDRLALMLWCHSYVLLLRWVISCATVYAGSARCVRQSLLHTSNAGFALNTGCFDLMFSGHASFSVLIGSFAAMTPGWSVATVKLPVLMFAVASAAVNVLVGDHFTADVLVGAYVGASIAALHRQQWRACFGYHSSSSNRGSADGEDNEPFASQAERQILLSSSRG